MSADFTTELTAKGTEEELLLLLNTLHFYADERMAQYRERQDCWYLNEKLGDITEETLSSYVEDGILSIGFDGPYGVMNGPVTDTVDLFERLADAAPGCSFEGSITGWDAGAEQGIDAKLENGLLYLRYSYIEFGGEDEEDESENDSSEADWDAIYDPSTKEYRKPQKSVNGDTVTVTIRLTDLQGKEYLLVLPSENIWHPTNLHCFPRDFLAADTADKLIALLLHAVSGDGWQKRKEEIRAWQAEIPADGFAALELKKIHDHREPLFFDWLRTGVFGDADSNLKKPAKKVIARSQKNKQENLQEFEKIVQSFEPRFPGCEWTGWPEFCIWRVKGDFAPGEKRNPFRPYESDHRKIHSALDWRCAAESLEAFARLLCSKDNPREYAVETVKVDYVANTVEQTAVYMPGGPAPKAERG